MDDDESISTAELGHEMFALDGWLVASMLANLTPKETREKVWNNARKILEDLEWV